MTVRLRPHHLLCLLTYVGKGYTTAFTANYDVIAQRLSNGEAILIVAGPDDICAPLLGEREHHCFNDSVTARDHLAARDVGTLLNIAEPIGPGTTLQLDPHTISQLRNSFALGLIRQACSGCEWAGLCTQVATDGYQGARIDVLC